MSTTFSVRVHNSTWRIARDRSKHDRAVGYSIPSIAFVCPNCLVVWAHIWDTVSPCDLEVSSCEKCNSPSDWRHRFPGSILDSLFFESNWDEDLLDLLPPELLAREFRLHLTACGVPLEHNGTPFINPKEYPDVQSYLRALERAAASGSSVLGRLPCGSFSAIFGSGGK